MTAPAPTAPDPAASGAVLLHRQGKLAEAIEAYRRELARQEKAGAAAGVRSLLAANLAAACFDAGRVAQARKEAEEACALARSGERPEAEGMAWRVLGRIASRSGDPRGALDAFARAAACLESAGETRGQVSTHLGFADAYETLGEAPLARSHLEAALRLAEAERDEERACALRKRLASLLASGRGASGRGAVASDAVASGAAARTASDAGRTQPVSVEATPLELPEVSSLLEINKALNREQESARLFPAILDAAVSLTGAERGSLWIREASGLRVAAAHGPGDRKDEAPPAGEARVEGSASVAEECLRTARPVVSVDALDDERFSASQSVQRMQLRSLLAVPLRLGGSVRGALCVDTRLSRQAFGPRAVQLLSALAEQAAIAWTNAEMAERDRRQLREIAALNARLAGQVADAKAALQRVQARLSTVGRPEAWKERYGRIVGSSEAIRKLLSSIDRLLETDAPVLLSGESGTGKELVARALHEGGARRAGPFVAQNCAAISDTLLESELFGHTRGAFTGAVRDRKGLFEAADGGTLFLDEIGEMGGASQAALLRAVETGEIRPVGGTATRKVNVRIVSATHRDLEALIAEGRFRADLFYRLNTVTVRLPPLRERPEDLPELVAHLLERHASTLGREVPTVAPEVVDALCARAWPGNVRELENWVRRLLLLAPEGRLTLQALHSLEEESRGTSDADPGGGLLDQAVDDLEKKLIQKALSACHGNRTHAAARLGVSRNALLRKIAKFSLS
ncbi:MAG: sigma 54-interacting transcriptional regulator [Planctomycetes bacterium]|nr:sigma 54-interacting transcriptional regulator [Planctomycetota bacterium]